MAVANVRRVDLGGGVSLIFGDWTATLGAGGQTYTVSCGRVLMVQVNPLQTGETVDFNDSLFSVSQSGTIATLTIYGNAAISAGSFCLLIDQGGA